MRLRKQKEVQKENEFYMQLLQQALPPEQQLIQRQEREAEEGKNETPKGIKYKWCIFYVTLLSLHVR